MKRLYFSKIGDFYETEAHDNCGTGGEHSTCLE